MIVLSLELLAEARKRVANASGGPDGMAFSEDGVPTPAFVLALLDRIEELRCVSEALERALCTCDREETGQHNALCPVTEALKAMP